MLPVVATLAVVFGRERYGTLARDAAWAAFVLIVISGYPALFFSVVLLLMRWALSGV